ncbi:16S rRNA (uracil(1498)-N(3))-methyltransferase [Mesohalobacter halotolerans]|uniref:Ribosomal RNA small subunit methyltransferase E n=1 Tax=Mesohalobacter halotolerans TaxID=1883405 RepID=A0A4U5TQR7_9FLAO|nr:16S rRNA (uracil(1498)-N(3))-methyltransferase [Mesohalobacter halotolerans]MBS3738684.1 16S rRNA (uracil(1498)-N(3))-methyltransferase [Psychroflexus sp.]TKS56560.1 16S rRNA (uracil(1498)-N(3))-methyltransferase [Mesohalobacter halotolerans]
MQLFYDEHINSGTHSHKIVPDESRHILRVLRKQINDVIYLTNGCGQGFKCKISDVESKQCVVNILEVFKDKPLPYSLHIAIAPPKSSDRFEFFLEKATEIGISEITPILCQNSERKRLNMKRSQNILKSAMKQSQRLFLPKLNALSTFENFINQDFTMSKNLIAHCKVQDKSYLTNHIKTSQKLCILIGPEGDFDSTEIDMALKSNFIPVSFGQKRLRTETAGIFASQALALQHQI